MTSTRFHPLTPARKPSVRDELENLYLRRVLIDNLIRSMEVYTLLGHRWKAKARKAA